MTGTAFSWFSSLAPNSIRNWNQLEHKFHDHFFSGETKAKLLDLTSIKQGRDEPASDYFKRFKEIKNQCFSMTIFEKDLMDLAFNVLHSYLKEKLEGFEYHTVNFLQVKLKGLEFKLKMPNTLSNLIGPILIFLIMIWIVRTMIARKYMLLSLFGHQRPNPVQFRLLSRLKRIGKRS